MSRFVLAAILSSFLSVMVLGASHAVLQDPASDRALFQPKAPNQYDPKSKMVTLNLKLSDAEIMKFLKTLPDAAADIQPLRDQNRKRAELEQEHGLRVADMTGKKLATPVAANEFYDGLLNLAKSSLKEDRGTTGISLDDRHAHLGMTMDGTIHLPSAVTMADIAKAINQGPSKAEFEKRKSDIQQRLEKINVKLGKGMAVIPDFESNNTLDDAGNAAATLEDLVANGYTAKPPLTTIFFTGKQTGGGAGVSVWDPPTNSKIVMTSNATAEQLKAYLVAPKSNPPRGLAEAGNQ